MVSQFGEIMKNCLKRKELICTWKEETDNKGILMNKISISLCGTQKLLKSRMGLRMSFFNMRDKGLIIQWIQTQNSNICDHS